MKAAIEQAATEIAEEFKASDPDLKLTVSEKTDCSESAISAKDSARVIALIEALPNGIIRMSREIDKLVETSLNLGVLKSDAAAVTLRYAVRSSVGVAKKSLKNQLVCIAGALLQRLHLRVIILHGSTRRIQSSARIWYGFLRRCMAKSLQLRLFMPVSSADF